MPLTCMLFPVFKIAPVHEVPCTLLYGDNTLALTISDKYKNLRARHFEDFAHTLGLPTKAAKAAN